MRGVADPAHVERFTAMVPEGAIRSPIVKNLLSHQKTLPLSPNCPARPQCYSSLLSRHLDPGPRMEASPVPAPPPRVFRLRRIPNSARTFEDVAKVLSAAIEGLSKESIRVYSLAITVQP
ncbi:hypothetical protein B0T14DRAFT_2111 [Immersiella caudata]|uniref:Uncharacterized protein n=1 Tax=Immersiella caudata TaxID=314043 RepID=A0AA40CAR8_9PEZI|nr:hypothetical protein B0T14DRAFT_2111 [Immersiella caudata]